MMALPLWLLAYVICLLCSLCRRTTPECTYDPHVRTHTQCAPRKRQSALVCGSHHSPVGHRALCTASSGTSVSLRGVAATHLIQRFFQFILLAVRTAFFTSHPSFVAMLLGVCWVRRSDCTGHEAEGRRPCCSQLQALLAGRCVVGGMARAELRASWKRRVLGRIQQGG